MMLKRTRDAIEVVGYGIVPKDGTLEVPETLGEQLLAAGGWEREAKAAPKRVEKVEE